MIKEIHEVMEVRDRFAHGRISFSGTKPRIEYYNNGVKIDELTPEYMENVFEKMTITHDKLVTLTNELDKHKKSEN